MKKMHHKLLKALNSLLAALIATLGVTSCNSQKKLSKEPAIEEPTVEEQPHIMVKYGVPFRREETIRCMYGVPAPAPVSDIEQNTDTVELNAPARTMNAGEEVQPAKNERKDPLFLLNGKEIPAESVGQLNANNIGSMIVLTGEEAIKKYGERGRNGVVEIRSKSGK